MVTFAEFRKLALSFPGASEAPHFEKPSFRIKKRIFATYDETNARACLKLSEMDQNIFSLADHSIIYPVPNKWGKQGWTLVELKRVRKDLFFDALKTAFSEVYSTKKQRRK